MINKVSSENIDDFIYACKFEHIFGSKAVTALETFSDKNTEHSFYIGVLDNGKFDTSIYIYDGVAVISCNNQIDVNELADFLKSKKVKEIDTNIAQCNGLQTIMVGKIESSFYMKYAKKHHLNLQLTELHLQQTFRKYLMFYSKATNITENI